MKNDEFKRTARLSDAARQEVLDHLDSTGQPEHGGAPECNQRQDARWPYRRSEIAVTVEHPGGGVSRLLLFARNLSAGGISFVHNGFLYPGSRCKVILIRTDGEMQMVRAAIVRCRHVQGVLHEIGLKFESRIDPELFLEEMQNDARHASTLEVPELLGRIAVVESNPMEAALLQHHLKLGGVAATMLTTSGAALDLVKRHGADIILCELNITGCDGLELISKLRQSDFHGPVAVITAETDAARHDQARRAGALQVLAKPYDPVQLMTLVIELNQRIGTALTRSALFSSADEHLGMTDLIHGFIDQARQMARSIEQASRVEDLLPLRHMLLSLKGSASGYGFAVLGDLAAQALVILETRPTVAALSPRLRAICSLCRRLRMRPGKSGQGGTQIKSKAA